MYSSTGRASSVLQVKCVPPDAACLAAVECEGMCIDKVRNRCRYKIVPSMEKKKKRTFDTGPEAAVS